MVRPPIITPSAIWAISAMKGILCEALVSKAISSCLHTDAVSGERVSPAANPALARLTPGVAGPIRRPGKWIRSAKATEPPHLGQTLLLRGKTAVVVDAFPGIGRAPASAGPRRLAPLHARPAFGVSVGEQQSHYSNTEQNKTDRAHDGRPRSYGVSHSTISRL